MLNRIRPASMRLAYANELMASLFDQLRSGWNPWVMNSCKRNFLKFEDILAYYITHIAKLHSSGSVKYNTRLDYEKRVRLLRKYNSNLASPIVYIYQFDTTYISNFLDYILVDRDFSARTRNNYRTWLSSFSNWCQERGYLSSNPAENIRSITEGAKVRDAISVQDLAKIKNYLSKENPDFLLLCAFAYYTLIRPSEITNVRIKDLNLHEQKVLIPDTVSKNRRDGMVGLNQYLIKMMLDRDVFRYDADCYLFGPKFIPSRQKASPKIYRNYFYKVRNALHLPDTYHFYSLKDSGIRDLANAAGIVVARDQARHSDVSTTNRYLKGHDLPVHEETKKFEGAL